MFKIINEESKLSAKIRNLSAQMVEMLKNALVILSVYLCGLIPMAEAMTPPINLSKLSTIDSGNLNDSIKFCFAHGIELGGICVSLETVHEKISEHFCKPTENYTPIELSPVLKASQEYNRHIHQLNFQKRELSILCFGDTSAGKSLFLNLLLDANILPSSSEANSSCLCQLSYNEQKGATVFYTNEMPENIVANVGEQEFDDKVKRYLGKNNRALEVNPDQLIERVNLTLPHDLLKPGITLIDSPGLSEYMDDAKDAKSLLDWTKMAKEFLPNATCVICVIAANRGALDKHTGRMIVATKKVYERVKPGVHVPFLFILTKLDLVEKQDGRARISRDIKYMLRLLVPGLGENQILELNTQAAFETQKFRFMTKELKSVFDVIAGHMKKTFEIELIRIKKGIDLRQAAYDNNIEVAVEALSSGAYIEDKDLVGKTAMEIAHERGNDKFEKAPLIEMALVKQTTGLTWIPIAIIYGYLGN